MWEAIHWQDAEEEQPQCATSLILGLSTEAPWANIQDGSQELWGREEVH